MALSQTMACGVIEGVLVAVHSTKDPTDEEWLNYIECYKQHRGEVVSTLVLSKGGGPNTAQRAKMNEEIGDTDIRVAICTDARITRGIVTALRWFNSNIRAFSQGQLEGALRYLGVTDAQASRVLDGVNGMLADLGLGEK